MNYDGLDVVSQKSVREFLRKHNAQQKTTILLTAINDRYSGLCERVIIMITAQFRRLAGRSGGSVADSKLVTINAKGLAIVQPNTWANMARSWSKRLAHSTESEARPGHISRKALLDDCP